MGVAYAVQARHGGQDPWLFFDLRAGRRRVMAEAAGKSVLNLFAYTCGVGIAAAAVAGAKRGAECRLCRIEPGRRQAERPPEHAWIRPKFVRCDAFAAMRQLSASASLPSFAAGAAAFPKLETAQFDLVFLDPPRHAKSPFGVVDLVNDYPSVFKPALLATAEGGTLICCNNVAQVERDAWRDQLERSARKAGGRSAMEWILPEADFPSIDGKPPLKIALLRL